MKTITFYADTNKSDDVIHIETDGCIVNIHVGLHDAEGRAITRVDVMPDRNTRGGDGSGDNWEIHPEDGNGVTRVVRVPDAVQDDAPYVSAYGDGLPEVNIDGEVIEVTKSAPIELKPQMRVLVDVPEDDSLGASIDTLQATIHSIDEDGGTVTVMVDGDSRLTVVQREDVRGLDK